MLLKVPAVSRAETRMAMIRTRQKVRTAQPLRRPPGRCSAAGGTRMEKSMTWTARVALLSLYPPARRHQSSSNSWTKGG